MPKLDDVETGVLAFSKPKQAALLGYVLTNRSFFLQVRPYLKPEWFSAGGPPLAYSLLLKHYAARGFPQSIGELLDFRDYRSEDGSTQKLIRETIKNAQEKMLTYSLETVVADFSAFARAVALQEATCKSSDEFNQRKIEQAFASYEEGYHKMVKAKLIHGEPESWELDSFVAQLQAGLNDGLAFGIPGIDRRLNPAGENGGLLRGDTTVIMAPVNIGKTTALITIIALNLLEGKHVLWLSHEGRPDDLKFKLLCCLLQVSREEFFLWFKTSKDFRERARVMTALVKSNLEYISYNRPFTTIQQIEALIRNKVEVKQAERVEGHSYDLLVDDYPALLNTPGYLSGEVQKRVNDEMIYGCFASLALEFGCHALLAVQTNREGSKINRGQTGASAGRGEGTRLLTMEDVSESWGIMAKATNVLTLNRSPMDKQLQRVVWYLVKSRSSDVDWAYVCRSNFGRSTTHSPFGWPAVVEPLPDVYGSTAYQSSEVLPQKMNGIIDFYRDNPMATHGGIIPFEDVHKGLYGTIARPLSPARPLVQA